MSDKDYLYRDTGYTKDGEIKVSSSYKAKKVFQSILKTILYIVLIGVAVWTLLLIIKPKAYTIKGTEIKYNKDLSKVNPNSIILVKDNRIKDSFGKEYVVESHVVKLPGSYVHDDSGNVIQLDQDQYMLTFDGTTGIVKDKDIIGVKK